MRDTPLKDCFVRTPVCKHQKFFMVFFGEWPSVVSTVVQYVLCDTILELLILKAELKAS
jgi:hypothetical protein